jgi:hypothetical protein
MLRLERPLPASEHRRRVSAQATTLEGLVGHESPHGPTTSANLGTTNRRQPAQPPEQTVQTRQEPLFAIPHPPGRDDSAQGTQPVRPPPARQPLMRRNLDPRKLHRQLGRCHSRVRQRSALEAARQSRYVGLVGRSVMVVNRWQATALW